MKGHQAIVNILKAEGVSFLSLFPGTGGAGTEGQIINYLPKVGIRPILVRSERVAVNVADGYTRVSGRTGVALISMGVGEENAYSGISQANSDRVPVLILAGGIPMKRVGTKPTQDFDAVATYGRITKWVERIDFVERIPEVMRRAFTYLRTGRPGPVYLEIPGEVAKADLAESDFEYSPVRGWKTSGNPSDVKAAVKEILAAKRPLIYAGEGVYYAQAWNELCEFAELVQAPVMTTLKGKGLFPENHPLSVGNGGQDGGKPAAHFLKEADLVFAIGASLTRGPGAPMKRGRRLIQSVVEEYDLNKDYLAQVAVVGDAQMVLAQMCEEVRRQKGGSGLPANTSLLDEIRRVKTEWLKEWMPKLTSNEVPINPYRIVWELMNTLDRKNTIITHDAGWPRDALAPFWETPTPRGYIGWGHHSTMGFSLGASLGAKIAEPGKTVVQFTGDGSFGMVGMDWEAAVRNKISILTVLINNKGLGHYFHDTPSTAALGGEYAKIAEALGGYGEKIEKVEDIIPAIKRGVEITKQGRPALLEFMISLEHDYNAKYWVNLYEK
jgi:acetolactate synthase-1/2/3 large subunit